jgi:hypothetical protein
VSLNNELLNIGGTPQDTRKLLHPNTVYDFVHTARAAVEYARKAGHAKLPEIPFIAVEGTVSPNRRKAASFRWMNRVS